jgi:hypothetical protein
VERTCGSGSLLDFGKIIEILDKNNATFVSVIRAGARSSIPADIVTLAIAERPARVLDYPGSEVDARSVG